MQKIVKAGISMGKRRIANMIMTICIIIAVVCTAFFAVYHKGNVPENPMTKGKTKQFRMYHDDNKIALSGEGVKGLENNTDLEDEEENREKDNKGENIQGSQLSFGGDHQNNRYGGNTTVNNKNSASSKGNTVSNSGTIYFTTSIIDGETVSRYEYSFTITHLVEELSVETMSVYVNGIMTEKFSGSVLLREGDNVIKISVTYRDQDEREIIAQKSYHVIVDTHNLAITTTLKEQTVDSPFLAFTAYALMGEQKAELKVSLNDREVSGNENIYSVTLNQGKNTIVLTAVYGQYSVTKKYEITFSNDGKYSIYTDLENQTVHKDYLTFKAMVLNGTSKAKLSVIVNGTIVGGKGEVYHVPLKIGNNTIRLKATDTNVSNINQTYTVKYVPIATKETAPKITYINVSDGMEIAGESFTLNIATEDYEGNRIYYDGIKVVLNGKKIQYRWSSKYTSYLLKFLNGNNKLEIRVTDKDGRYTDYSYSLKCTYIDEGTPIGTATVSIDAKVIHLGVLMKPKTVDIYYGDNVADVFERAMENSGYTYTLQGTAKTGFYIDTIARAGMLRGWKIDDALKAEILEDGLQFNIVPETGEYIYDKDSLSSLDFCQGSGWNYSVNGAYPEYGMSDYLPKNGDKIEIRYTLSYGKDIGAYHSSSGVYGIKEKYDNIY